ncbi:MAG TPA: sigma-54 dependent transcriptional regulator [bacterium]|nr:sigma-54 dependent transcriptional regulator [bacterium]
MQKSNMPAGEKMASEHILIVDDDPLFCNLLSDVLAFAGFHVVTALDGAGAWAFLERQKPDLLLLDLALPDTDGLQILQRVLRRYPDLSVVMISGQGSIRLAVEAVKLGAYDFIEKPVDAQRVLLTVRNSMQAMQLKNAHRQTLEKNLQAYGMIGASSGMQRVFSLIDALARTDTPVLITGENGTGKELVAEALHRLSRRAAATLVRVNCAAIPDTLLESELFGHAKGAFTDAHASHKGKFQLAHQGTLFLDEIGDLSLQAQAKILLALEQGEVSPLGSEEVERVDVRLICATNQELQSMLTEKRFREDLYYRINVVPIHLQPLRERPEDIVPLADYFLQHFCRLHGSEAKELISDAQVFLSTQPWPGNVRELKNTMEKLVILASDQRITARLVQNALKFQSAVDTPHARETLREAREAFERSFIQATLREFHGNMTEAAAALDIDRSHLYRKMEHLGLRSEET